MIKSLREVGRVGRVASSSPGVAQQAEQLGDELVLTDKKRLKRRTHLGEAKLKLPRRPLGLRGIEQVLFGPFAPESAQVTDQRRHLLKSDRGRFGEQLPGVVSAGVEFDELAMDTERVLMVEACRKQVALDKLERFRTIGHDDPAVSQADRGDALQPGPSRSPEDRLSRSDHAPPEQAPAGRAAVGGTPKPPGIIDLARWA
jgi:hypothetical protein